MASSPEKRGLQRYVLLPTAGFRAAADAFPAARRLFMTIASHPFLKMFSMPVPDLGAVKIKVVDSIHKDGAKLVEMTESDMRALRHKQPHLRLVPVVHYRPARMIRRIEEKAAPASARKKSGLALKVLTKGNGAPVAGAQVIAFTDFMRRSGAAGVTNGQGIVTLRLGGRSARIDRLYVYPARGLWSRLLRSTTIRNGQAIEVDPLDLAFSDFKDCLRHFYSGPARGDGAGVKVGVVDTGIDLRHPDLVVSGGRNTVVGEKPEDFGDNGQGHGSHVAGIIGARGAPPSGVRGVAPKASLFSYRVFGQDADGATNYSIAKALDWAANEDGCHLINMSLGGGAADEAIKEAIDEARARGAAVIAAAGNDDRGPVSFPALYLSSIAVSAMGRQGTFPSGSSEEGDVQEPFGTDPADFVASFSNIGPEIDVVGPGVGVVSTVPGGHAPMSGTSMACPAVTGFGARLLSDHPEILELGGPARSDAIMDLILKAARPRGFGRNFEGSGLPL